MEMEPFENPWMKKIRVLTHMLILSVAVNTGCITAFLYMRFHSSKKVQEYVEGKKGEKEESIASLLNLYFSYSFDQLVSVLKDPVLVQDGLCRRDLALACLVNFHGFNLEKGVSGRHLEKRRLSFVHLEGKETFYLEVFPGLDDLQFERIQNYLREEKWPLTAEGLFLELKKRGSEAPQSLFAAFFATSDFCAIQTLFGRVDKNKERERVLELILHADWEDVRTLAARARREEENPLLPLREFFQSLFQKGAKEVLPLWIELDRHYLERKLADQDLLHVIRDVREKSQGVELFLKELLCSVRSDTIRKEAALKLFSFDNRSPPDPYDHEEVLKIFFPNLSPQKPSLEVHPPAPVKKYKVVEGDSLWKVAKKHKVEMERLREINHLKNDQLKPGQELIIP